MLIAHPERDTTGAICAFRVLHANDVALSSPVHPLAPSGSAPQHIFVGDTDDPLFLAMRRVAEGSPAVTLPRLSRAYPDEISNRTLTVRIADLGTDLAVTWRDLTDDLAYHDLLESSERKYRALATNEASVMVEGDRDGYITWISPGVRNVLGCEPEDMLGLRFRDLVHPDDREAMVSFGDLLAAGGHGARLVRLRDGAGRYRNIHFAAAALYDRTGAIVGRVASWHDLTREVEVASDLSMQ
jgi:PAS domain S-box-containing protein